MHEPLSHLETVQSPLPYYQSYRQSHPLPPGWTERHIPSPDDTKPQVRYPIVFENEDYFVSFNIYVTGRTNHDPRWTLAQIVRKDRQLPEQQESVDAVRLLLGQEVILTSITYLEFNGQAPDGTLIISNRGADLVKEPELHYALRFSLHYPPYATKSVPLPEQVAFLRDLPDPTSVRNTDTSAALAAYADRVQEIDQQSAVGRLLRQYPTFCEFCQSMFETWYEISDLVAQLTGDEIRVTGSLRVSDGPYSHQYAILWFNTDQSPSDPTDTLKKMNAILAPLLATFNSFARPSEFKLDLKNNRVYLDFPLVYFAMLVAYLQLKL